MPNPVPRVKTEREERDRINLGNRITALETTIKVFKGLLAPAITAASATVIIIRLINAANT